jgi:hypothetical protein
LFSLGHRPTGNRRTHGRGKAVQDLEVGSLESLQTSEGQLVSGWRGEISRYLRTAVRITLALSCFFVGRNSHRRKSHRRWMKTGSAVLPLRHGVMVFDDPSRDGRRLSARRHPLSALVFIGGPLIEIIRMIEWTMLMVVVRDKLDLSGARRRAPFNSARRASFTLPARHPMSRAGRVVS